MLANLLHPNRRRTLTARITGLMCVIMALFAPTVSAQNTVAVTFNTGYDGSEILGFDTMEHINLDCSSLKAVTDYDKPVSVTKDGLTFSLIGPMNDVIGQPKLAPSFSVRSISKSLLIVNQIVSLSLDGNRGIKAIKFYYADNDYDSYFPASCFYLGRYSSTKKAEVEITYDQIESSKLFNTPVEIASKYVSLGVYLQAAVIEYTGEPLVGSVEERDADPIAEEISFTMPSITGVKAVVKNGDTELKGGEKVTVGTSLSVTLTPTDPKNKITEVTYGDAPASGTFAEDGSWSGTIVVKKDAKWNVKTEVKTLTISCTANGGANVSFVNPSNGQVLDQPIAYDTSVGIKIDGYANGKEIASVVCTDSKGNVVGLGAGNANCYGTVKITDNLSVVVTLKDKEIKSYPVTFSTSLTGGSISVTDGNGAMVNSGAMVADGTKLTIKLTPNDGYAIGSLKINSQVFTSNPTDYTVNESAVNIDATFVKMYKVEWTAPSNGTMTVTYNGNTFNSGDMIKGGEKLIVTLTPDGTVPNAVTSLDATGATVKSLGKNQWEVTISDNAVLKPYIGKKLNSYQLTTNIATGGTVKLWTLNEKGTETPVSSGANILEGTMIYGKVTTTKVSGYDYELKSIGVTAKGAQLFPISPDSNGDFSFAMPGQAATVTAEFEKIMPDRTITVNVTGLEHGSISYTIKGDNTEYSISASGDKIIAKEGSEITFTISATTGYKISSAPNTSTITYTTDEQTQKVGTYVVKNNQSLSFAFAEIKKNTLTLTGVDKLLDGAKFTAEYNGAPITDQTEIPEGGKVTFTLTAPAEYTIATFRVGNQSATVGPNAEEATIEYVMPANKPSSLAVSATFNHKKTSIYFKLNDTNITEMGSVSASCGTKKLSPNSTESQSVPTNSPITITVTPKSGYQVATVTVNDKSYTEADEEYSIKNGQVTLTDVYTTPKAGQGVGNMIVSVTFKEIPQYFKVTISAVGGKVADKDKPLEVEYGTVTYSGAADLTKVLKGTTVDVTAEPETNYQIKSITVNGNAQDFDINAQKVTIPVVIKQATNIVVNFELRTYRVQLFASPSQGGSPYIGSNKETSVQSFSKGSRVTIYAPVNPGYKFVKWMLNGQDVKNGNVLAGSTYSFTMPEGNQVFTAVYDEIKYKAHSVSIQVAKGQEDWGEIGIVYPSAQIWTSWNQSSVYIKDWNQYVKVEATPKEDEEGNARYYFDSWQISGAGAGTVTQTADEKGGSLEYGGDNNVTITARFGQKYRLEIVKPENGTIEVTLADGTLITQASGAWLKAGTRVNVKMTANKNYNVATLVVNDRETGRYNRPGTVTTTVTINADTRLNALFYNPTGIDDIEADGEATDAPEQWFTVQGQYLGTERPTAPGLYIRRCGNEVTKVAIRQ